MNSPPPNLLDEALGASSASGRVVLVEDCVETSGAFVLHHLLKRALTREANGTVVFLALAQPFSHYDRVLRKMGCNLSIQRNNNKLHFFDMLKLEFPGGKAIEEGFIELYSKIRSVIEASCSPSKYDQSCVTILIDDLSLFEIAAHGFSDHLLNFLHYCVTLTSESDCSLVILNHEDIYLNDQVPRLDSHLAYLADIVIKIEPLTTGLAADVHGQLTVMNKGPFTEHGYSVNRIHNFHFKVKENGTEYFYPGSQH